jgi:hypothetical protein
MIELDQIPTSVLQRALVIDTDLSFHETSDDRVRIIAEEILLAAEGAARADGRREALLNFQDRLFVDVTPDDGLPVRILRAYLDYSTVSDNTLGLPPENPLCIAMNEAQGKRNAIIEQAIRALEPGS